MIALRQARGRWSDDDAAEQPTDAHVDGQDEDGPIEIAVLELPAFDLNESVAVRNRAAGDDRRLRLATMVRRADDLLAQLHHEATAEPDEDDVAIDLRDEAHTVIDLDAEDEPVMIDASEMQHVVAAIRRLSELRDNGLITTPEFDARMTDLLAQV